MLVKRFFVIQSSLANQGYQQPCASWLPCSTTPTSFTCDDKSGTCLCSSASTYYYTQYYTGAVTDLYGGSGGMKRTYKKAFRVKKILLFLIKEHALLKQLLILLARLTVLNRAWNG